MTLTVATTINNTTTHSATLDTAAVKQALADALVQTLVVPPTGVVTHEVKFTPNLNQDTGETTVTAHVTVTVNHLLPANPGRIMPVTRRQAMQALILNDLDGQVQAAIEAITDPVQRRLMRAWFNDSLTFERDRPELTAMCQALGWSDEQVDALFLQAAAL